MPQSLHIFTPRALQRAAGEYPLIEGNQEAWIACCSERFFPLAKRIARDNGLAEDALQASWIKILQAVNRVCFNGPKACGPVLEVVLPAIPSKGDLKNATETICPHLCALDDGHHGWAVARQIPTG